MRTSSAPTIFYIIRHGQTEWNVKNLLHGGGSHTSLNETGEKQAQELTTVLHGIHFDKIFSSDLERSIDTVKGIALEQNLTIKTSEALREKNYGKYEGKHRIEVKEELQDLFEQWEKLSDAEKMKFRVYKTGETDNEAITRFIRHLKEIAFAYPGKTILISSHGGIMRYLLIKLGWGTYKELPPPSIPNISYIKLASDGIDFEVIETYHIQKAEE
jgi:broad specificity phosphatase PhoE